MSMVRSEGVSMGLLGFVDTVQDGEDLKINQSSRDALLWLLGSTRARATAAGDGKALSDQWGFSR